MEQMNIENTKLLEGMETIPPGTEEILPDTFAGRGDLREVEVPGSVKKIGDRAFAGCTSLREVKLEDGVRSVGKGCFAGCISLETVIFPDSAAGVKDGCFQDCSSLKLVHLPERLVYVDQEVFAGCTSLEEITIPAQVKMIGAEAFRGCTALRKVSFAGKDTRVYQDAFQGCTALSTASAGEIAGRFTKPLSFRIRTDREGIAGRMSTFARRDFLLDGVPCSSIESALQSFRFEDEMEQAEICAMEAPDARWAQSSEAWKETGLLYWQGRTFPRESQEYQELLDHLFMSVYEQDNAFRVDVTFCRGAEIRLRNWSRNPAAALLTQGEFLARLKRLSWLEEGETLHTTMEEILAAGGRAAGQSESLASVSGGKSELSSIPAETSGAAISGVTQSSSAAISGVTQSSGASIFGMNQSLSAAIPGTTQLQGTAIPGATPSPSVTIPYVTSSPGERRIVVMGGSFNPPTLAHYRLMAEAVEASGAEKGIFVPSNHEYVEKKMQRQRQKNLVLSEETRLAMLQAMCKDDGRMTVDTCEYGRISRAKTYETMETIQEKYSDAVLYFVAGGDKLSVIPRWHKAEAFLEQFRILVVTREGMNPEAMIGGNPFLCSHAGSFALLQKPEGVEGISSTSVRKLLQEGDSEGAKQVHPQVWEMLLKEGWFVRNITSFRGSFEFLSNFYEAPVEFDGLLYGNNEAAFQAQKCLTQEERKIFTGMRPAKAKRAGRQVQLRPDWEEVKCGLMEEIVRAKFTQNPELAMRLLATEDRLIQEGNTWHDTYWGVDSRTGEGENHLGKILMKVREEIRENLSKPTCARRVGVPPSHENLAGA